MWHETEQGSVGDADGGGEQYASDRPCCVRRITSLNSRPNALPASVLKRNTDIALFYCEQYLGSWLMHCVCNRISLVEYRWHD